MSKFIVCVVNTNNGERIGIDLVDTEADVEVLETNLSERKAVIKCQEWSKELNIPEFNADEDTLITVDTIADSENYNQIIQDVIKDKLALSDKLGSIVTEKIVKELLYKGYSIKNP